MDNFKSQGQQKCASLQPKASKSQDFFKILSGPNSHDKVRADSLDVHHHATTVPRGGHSNPTVYRYTQLRLNTQPGEGMTECIVWVGHVLHSVCIFLPSFFSVFKCQCVFTCEPAGRSHPPTPLPQYICYGEQQGVCVQAHWCVCLRNAEQPRLPPHTGTKKSRSQEATLKYQVLIWQIQATGVFTFQRLKVEKVQMPQLAVSMEITHIAMGDRHVCMVGSI